MGYCMDSKEFWLDTLKGFIDADKSGELESACAAEDTELYRITAHSIKSAAKTIGAELLSERARLLEFAARDNDTAYIKSEHSGFVEDYRKLLKDLEKVMLI